MIRQEGGSTATALCSAINVRLMTCESWYRTLSTQPNAESFTSVLPMIERIDQILTEWAEWLNSIPGDNLGYPRQTAEQRTTFDTSARRVMPDNPEMEWIDTVICNIGKSYPQEGKAIHCRYVRGMGNRQSAVFLRWSDSKFRQTLGRAHLAIDVALSYEKP